MVTYTDRDCLNAIRRVTDELGRPPTYQEYLDSGESPSAGTLEDRFGSWRNAKEQAGVESYITQDYFKDIDTAEKAYWLGFLWGDGSLARTEGYRYSLKLELSQKDGDHVRAFADAISSHYAVQDVSRHVEVTRTAITNQPFIGYAMRAGLHPDKVTVPDLGTFRWPFLRGLYDADGCFSYTRAHPLFVLSSKKDAHLNRVRRWFDAAGIDSRLSTTRSGYTGEKSGQLCVNKLESAEKLRENLWPDGSETEPCLDRKRDAAFNVF